MGPKLPRNSLPPSARPAATERVSVSSARVQGDGFSVAPAISASGRHVALESNASNLVAGDTNETRDIFTHDVAGASLSPR